MADPSETALGEQRPGPAVPAPGLIGLHPRPGCGCRLVSRPGTRSLSAEKGPRGPGPPCRGSGSSESPSVGCAVTLPRETGRRNQGWICWLAVWWPGAQALGSICDSLTTPVGSGNVSRHACSQFLIAKMGVIVVVFLIGLLWR